MPCLPSTVSRFPFPVSRFPSAVSPPFRCLVSRLLSPVCRFPFPVSRFPSAVSRFPFPVSRFPFPVSRFPSPVSRLPFHRRSVALSPVCHLPFPVSRLPFPVSRLPFHVSRLTAVFRLSNSPLTCPLSSGYILREQTTQNVRRQAARKGSRPRVHLGLFNGRPRNRHSVPGSESDFSKDRNAHARHAENSLNREWE